MALKFRVELVWEDEQETASSIYLTGDGRVVPPLTYDSMVPART